MRLFPDATLAWGVDQPRMVFDSSIAIFDRIAPVPTAIAPKPIADHVTTVLSGNGFPGSLSPGGGSYASTTVSSNGIEKSRLNASPAAPRDATRAGAGLRPAMRTASSDGGSVYSASSPTRCRYTVLAGSGRSSF